MIPLSRILERLVIVAAAGLALALPFPTHADEYAPDELILKLGPSGDIDSLNAVWGTITIDSIPGRGIYLIHLTDPAIQDSLAEALDGVPESEFCDYDHEGESPEARRQIVVIMIGATGADVEDQGAMARVRKDEAHAYATGSGALVALLDTGFELDHPFLAGRFETALGADFVDGDSDPSEEANGFDDDADGLIDEGAGHGTMVAGIVATIAPDARILPIRVLDDEGRGTVFPVLKGLYLAADMGSDVISLSLGSEGDSDAIEDALEEIALRGIPVVGAGGNDSANTAQYPARDSKAIAVTATDSADVKASFANYSSDIDLSAPGVGILSTFLDGGFGLGLGTSFAAPFVSGTIALLHERFAGASPESLEAMLMAGSVYIDSIPGNVPWTGDLGAGRIDCLGALLAGNVATGVMSPPIPSGAGGEGVALRPSMPNPSRGPTLFRFFLDREAPIRIEVFSPDGRLVLARSLGRLHAGENVVAFDARDAMGHTLGTGRFLYRVVAPHAQASGRIIIVR